MKYKRFAAAVLALILVLPAAVPAVSAAGFSDVTGSWAWAEEYIEDMTQRGIFNGYEDGTFRPANELTASEALALCARCIGLSDDVTAAIAKDRAGEISGIFGTSLSWFQGDFAVCLELGVVTPAELKSLWQSGALSEPIQKQNFAVYLVRAMGLSKLADSLSSYSVSFADRASISAACLPYVYLLNAYGIVEGTAENNFEPKSSVNRAVSAAMLSRLEEFMEKKGLSVELAGYTDYDWTSGTVVSAAAGDNDAVLLTLNTGDGTETYSLDADIPIYLNNMLVEASSTKTGMYARVNLDGDDPVSVRLIPEDRLKTVSAEIDEVTGDSLALLIDGTAQQYSLDRFTRVTVNGKTGGTALINLNADYADAVCILDGDDVLAVTLTGGSTPETGLLTEVSAGTSETVIRTVSFDGLPRTFTVPSSASITVDGQKGTLKTDYEGRCVSVRISDDGNGQVVSVAVDSKTDYVQGEVVGTVYTSNPYMLYLDNLATGESESYPMADDPDITYEGSQVTFQSIAKGWYFTASLNGDGEIETLQASDGKATVDGTVTAIHYDLTTVLTVTAADGEQYAFSLNMADLPAFTRDGETSTIDKLRVGDTVSVTAKYNEITLIQSEPKQADITGTITSIVRDLSGSTLELKLEDGSTASYAVSGSVTVTNDGQTVSFSSLAPGDKVSLAVNGDQAVSIEVVEQSDDTSASEITGMALYINTTDKTILLRLVDEDGSESVITVSTHSSTMFTTVEGSALSLSKLEVGDELILYGAYDADGFDANLIICK